MSGRNKRPRRRSEKQAFQKTFTDRSGRTHALRRNESGPERGPEKEQSKHRSSKHEQTRHAKPSRHGKPPKHGSGAPARGATKAKATIDKNHKGFGFLLFEDRKREDAFVPPRQAETFFHGDRVEASLDSRGNVTHLELIEHRFRELVGRFTPHPMGASRGGWVVYERKRAREEVFVPKAGEIQAGDWVRAKLEFHEKGPFPVTAEILDTYGPMLPPSADVPMLAAEYNLFEEHSKTAIREAEGFRLEITPDLLRHRRDLRNVGFITIDGETARDFDDAVFVERKKSGYVLWVAIADVSHYVQEGNALDHEARSRGTSVYFPERAFHMLPRALSENLCSLRPNEPRLALAARMEFDRAGKRTGTWVCEAVIESKRRATYNQIQAEWEQHQRDPDWEFAPHFGLYRALREMRLKRGSVDFDLPEAELNVRPDGEVVSIGQRPRLDAHRLIEEFMIAANESVTEWMMERNWPFVFRIHEEPAQQSLEKFQALAKTVGVHFSIEDAAGSPKVLADLVKRFEGHPAQTLLNTALLRSMKQAIYSSTHGIHYGLASQAYTHFTSPIRRYPDLVVHRLIRRALQQEQKKKGAPEGKPRQGLERELSDVCEHCSYRERLASDAERESIKLKQARLMQTRLGDEFPARIVGMTDNGMFVRVDDPYVEGMVTRESITDDFYEFNEDRMIFFGRRSRRTFKIGDVVTVRVLRADLERRQVDFGLTR